MKSKYYYIGYVLGTIFISIVIKLWLAPQDMSIWGGVDEGGGVVGLFEQKAGSDGIKQRNSLKDESGCCSIADVEQRIMLAVK